MPTNHRDPGKEFRDLIVRPQGVFGYGVENAIGAMMAEQAGIECIYAGGWSIAASKGLPDLGQVTMVEQLTQMREIVRSTSLPVIADIDDGYGNALNAGRTVAKFFGFHEYDLVTGDVRRLAGVHIEDQVLPKKCGHIAGKTLVSRATMEGKMRMAVRVRNGLYPSGVIIARTDAFNSKVEGSMDEAIVRATAYADCGADLLWCEFNQCDASLAEAFAEGVRKRHSQIPLAFNYSPSLPWIRAPFSARLTFENLVTMGYKFVFVTIADFHAHTLATYEYAKRFRQIGAAALWDMQVEKRGHPTEDHQKLIRVDKWQELEREFVPGASEKQDRGEGFKK